MFCFTCVKNIVFFLFKPKSLPNSANQLTKWGIRKQSQQKRFLVDKIENFKSSVCFLKNLI